MEATNSSLRQQLQEIQGKLENSQLQEESEIARFRLSQKICELNHQLAAYKAELAKDATEKDCIKAEVEAFKGNFKYTVVNFSSTLVETKIYFKIGIKQTILHSEENILTRHS